MPDRAREGPDAPMWREAIGFAARAHRHEVRKDTTTPYVAHVVRVMMIVRDVYGCDDDHALTAAVLHDTIEDTPADYDDIADRFGADVADCVAALSKNMLLPEDARETDYDERLARADWRARLIKLADTHDNMLDSRDRSEKAKRSAASKCRRALDLARADADAHEATRRAIDRTRALLAEIEGMMS